MFQRRFLLPLVIILLLSVSCTSPEPAPEAASATNTPFIIPDDPTSEPTEVPESTPTEVPESAPTEVPESTPTEAPKSAPTEAPEPTATEEEQATPTEVAARNSIIVGSKPDTQQMLLGKMLVFALQEAELEVEDQTGSGDTQAMRIALENGELDLYWESVLSGLTEIHQLSLDVLPENRQKWYPLLKGLDKSNPFVWLDPIEFNEEEQMAPVVRQLMLERAEVNEVLVNLLAEVGPRLDEETMSELKACVEIDGNSVDEVANAFFHNESLACLPTKIVVGSKQLTEHVWGGKILVLVLQAAGYNVVDKTNTGPTDVVREAALNGEIDLYLEVISTALTIFHNLPPQTLPTELSRAFGMAKALDEKNDLIWLKPVEKVETTYTLMMQESRAEEQGINTIEDLASFMNANEAPFTLCVEEDFATRPDGLPGIEEVYGFKFKEENTLRLSARENYAGLLQGDCDVAQGLTVVDIEPFGFKILEDTQTLFLPFTPAPVIRKEVLEEYPELEGILAQVVDTIEGGAILQLNALVEVGRDGVPNSGDEESPDTIARLVLCQVGLLTENCATDPVAATGDNSPDDNDATPTADPNSPPSQCQELALNGSFESVEDDPIWGFGVTASPPTFTSERVHSGESALYLGIMEQKDDRNSQSLVKQLISIPADAQSATLSYWYNPVSADFNNGDAQGGLIYNNNETVVLRKLMRDLSDEQLWSQQTDDLSAFIGEDIILYFYVENDGNGLPSGMYLDDVSVEVCRGTE